MRKYLATLHKRPHHHKKRFALAASGGFTLLVFGIWALVNFGGEAATVANVQSAAAEQANPFGSLWRGLGASFQALRGNVDELKNGLEVINSQTDTYGR